MTRGTVWWSAGKNIFGTSNQQEWFRSHRLELDYESICWSAFAASASGSAEPPSSTSEASRAERKRVAHTLSPSGTSPVVLPASHTSGLGGATSKLAPVVRFQRTRYSGTTTANGFDSRPHCWGRAREHRELNRRDNPPDGSKAGLKAPPGQWTVIGSRAAPMHGGVGHKCRFGKAPPSRSDRPSQGARERVGRGSLQLS